MPIRFLHLNVKMAGSFLKIGKRKFPFGISNVSDLIKPRQRVANMCRISHRFFADTGKREGRGRQQGFVRRRQAAARRCGVGFPGGGGRGFVFCRGFHFTIVRSFVFSRGDSCRCNALIVPE